MQLQKTCWPHCATFRQVFPHRRFKDLAGLVGV